LRALIVASELLSCSIRRILLADVLTDLLQFESDRGNGIAAGPEMFAREICRAAAKLVSGASRRSNRGKAQIAASR